MSMPRVCAIEWDGRYLATAIEDVIFIFVPIGADADNGCLRLELTVELIAGGGHKVHRFPDQPRPQLLPIAGAASRVAWTIWEHAQHRRLRAAPAGRIYHDRTAEFFDRSRDIAEIIANLADHLDMNQHLQTPVQRPSP